jgi:hypothetical protein
LELGHCKGKIEAMAINGSCGNSGLGNVVVAESLCVSTDGVEVCVPHGLLSSQAFLYSGSVKYKSKDDKITYSMVVSQKLVKEVNGLIADETLVLSVDK